MRHMYELYEHLQKRYPDRELYDIEKMAFDMIAVREKKMPKGILVFKLVAGHCTLVEYTNEPKKYVSQKKQLQPALYEQIEIR